VYIISSPLRPTICTGGLKTPGLPFEFVQRASTVIYPGSDRDLYLLTDRRRCRVYITYAGARPCVCTSFQIPGGGEWEGTNRFYICPSRARFGTDDGHFMAEIRTRSWLTDT